ncbi:purine-nucleoside phosphorylase [Reichenbachiella sp. 5M10]|uniref:purine-nucleoside phosphorylase n=1 Tax=Reichenbachiella sp. 5M10 TaxID=1889772 RepID=UPI000C14B0D2|nr:purine-nucleoside phosphorylase [Reichenbachiella sp. 5M10]PIB36036.1 purine-nucleoside phosphorylase [Reichenbachiella sp. 5M10]
MEEYNKIKEATAYIQSKVDLVPVYGIVLGTGLGALVDDIEVVAELSYEDIPHFPISTVEFHTGKLIFGLLGGKPVVTMKGRFHYYEGYTMKEVTFPIRVMKLLGIKKLLISNAAGALNPDFAKSDLMILEDHINLQTENPLVGRNLNDLGDRFPDMSEPYDLTLIDRARRIAVQHQTRVHVGVYVGVNGPNLETRAEYKMLRILGADAVGMSTVPETIVARQMSLPVFAISVLTDLCYPGHIEKVKIQDIIAAAEKAEPAMTEIMRELITQDEL